MSASIHLVPPDATPSAPDADFRAKLEALNGTVARALGDAKTLTETEVLAAGETLASILGESQAQLEETNLLTREFASTAEQNSLANVAGRLLEVLGDTPKLLEGVAGRVGDLAKAAQTAQTDTRKILALVATVKRISASTKLLALNTRIEASRLGANEKALAVLSAEMRSLSDEVTDATVLMEELAESLTESLPSVAKGAAELVDVCVSQAGGVSNTVKPFRAAYGRARESVEGALSSSRARLERIQAKYTTILQNLQFQDRASQQMQYAQDAATVLTTAMHEIVTMAEQAGPDSPVATAILERCRQVLTVTESRQQAPDAPALGTSGEIQFL